MKLAEEYAEKSFHEANKIKDIEMMSEAASSLSATLINQAEYTKLIDMNSQVIDLMEKTGKETEFSQGFFNPYSFLCGTKGLSLALLGDFEEGEVVCKKGLIASLEIEHSFSIAISELYCSWLYIYKGDGKLCVEHSQNLIKNSEDSDTPHFLALGCYILGTGNHYIGDILAATELIEEGIKIMSEHGITLNLSHLYNALSLVHYDSGDLKTAHGCAQKALEMSKAYNEINAEGTSRIYSGRVLGKMDLSKIGEAEESIFRGMKIHEDRETKPLLFQGNLFLGELYAYAGQMEKAIENLTKAESEFKDMGIDYWLARTYAVYSEMYKIDGDIPTAKENLNKAIEILRECGADEWVEKYEKELAAIS